MSITNHRIVIKHSYAPGAYPDVNDLVPGELALNATDNKLFYRGEDGTLISKDLDFSEGDITALVNSIVNSGVVKSATVNTDGRLIVTYRDNQSVDLGNVRGPAGQGIAINGIVDWADQLPLPVADGGGTGGRGILPENLNKSGTIFSVKFGPNSATPLVDPFDSPEMYLYDSAVTPATNRWTNIGALQGPQGEPGPASAVGEVNSLTTSDGTALLDVANIKFTANGLTTNPPPGVTSGAGRIVVIGSNGFLTSESRLGIDTRTSYTPAAHSHGNISNTGTIGTLANQVVTTTTGGALTVSSREGIDTRTSFPAASHTHGSITSDGKITAAAVTVTANDSVVITQADGTIARTSRNGIDTRTSFPVAPHTHGNITNDGKMTGTIIQSPFGLGPGDSVLITSPLGDNLIQRASREGIDSRTSFPPNSHTHGNISNDGKITVAISTVTNNDSVVITQADGTIARVSRNNIDSRTQYPPTSHSHGNIANNGTIAGNTTADQVVITTTNGALTVRTRSGIDTRTSFPNSDITTATASAIPGRLVRRDSSANATFNTVEVMTGHDFGLPGTSQNEWPEYIIGYNHESLELVNSSGGLGIITVHPDVLPSPRTNVERRRLYKTPNANGIFALTSQDDGTIGISDIVDLEDELAKSIRPTDVSSLRKAANIIAELWEKGAKALTISADNLNMYASSSTGYIKVLNQDASMSTYGSGISGEPIAISTNASPTDINNRLPKFFAVFPCNEFGSITGDLIYLDCSESMLTCLDVSTLWSLTALNCENNDLTHIYLPETENTSSLVTLYCNGNRLTRLNTKNLPNLAYLNCSFNFIKSLDFSQNSQLYNLYCHHNNITSLFVQGCNSLGYIDCSYNNLAVLNVSNLTTLASLYCQHNSLTSVYSTSLNLNGCSALNILDCSYNAMVGAAFNLAGLGLTSCQTIDASNNSITLALVSDLSSLISLDLSSNLLQTGAMNDLFVSLWNHPLIIDGYNEYPVATLWYGYNPAVTNPDPDPALDVNLAPDSWTLIPYSPED